MKNRITLSLLAVSSLYGADVELQKISVESTLITEVAQNAQTSADVAQALSDKVPSIDMSRRSAIANDILIRGQKRDNISVDVDGTKVYGACPNRMDPPVSHILANQIESIEVIEGPYDVENFGTLSGGIKIETKKPSKEAKGELNIGAGSFGYRKFGASASGGNERIRVSVAASMESSNQYKDGNGDTLSDQINNYGVASAKLQPEYEDMKAYSKKSVMAKAFITTLKDQELRLSVTANRSNDVLYANSKMDAIYDDSNIYSVAYNINNISDVYKNINLQYYHSDVDHPMGTDFRMASYGTNPTMTSWLKTNMDGLKLKNSFELSEYKLGLGLDASTRKWDGQYYKNGVMLPDTGTLSSTSMDNAITKNSAIFATLEKDYGDLNIKAGARYDATNIQSDDVNQQSNDYSAFNVNLFTTYALNRDNHIFFGLGQASRVPDARELYFKQNKPAGAGIKVTGTDNLKQTTNQEIDLGYEADADSFKFKVKAFYSMLQDYIYYNKSLMKNNFENVDATIYGAELSASIYATDDLTFDMAASYKVGKKEEALTNQSDTNMADMAPLRANIAANYEYANNSMATIEVVASDAWSEIDAENGEQKLDSWSILNMKVKHAVNKKFDFTLGVNNLLDETYAQSNTYADLILLTGGGADVMLMNEPGRYLYTNLDFKF
ncbi:MAG: TonB-dependent receptor [Campylobacterota bacterium]|nr:TonB-dependent receptor [Campylobacterota bacterium]